MIFELFQEPGDRVSIQLQPYEGEELRSLIIRNTDLSYPRYLEQVGLQQTNVSNYLCGRNRMSLAVLAKLLAGTNLQLQCTLHVTIKSGNDAEAVACTPLEEMLYSEEQDMSEVDNTTTHQPCPTAIQFSSLLEKPQVLKRITPESPLAVPLDVSSI